MFISDLVVSTDDKNIAKVAKSYGADAILIIIDMKKEKHHRLMLYMIVF